MGLILLNLQSNQQINLDKDNPLVIGRGGVTGCEDKRVSRTHGKITCRTDGKVTLKALHSNPCFFTKKGAGPVLQLNKDEEEVLSEGDCLGLLANSYWYQITSESSVKDNESQDVNLESSQSTEPETEVTPETEDTPKVEESDPKPECSQTSGCLNNTPQKDDYAVAGPSRAREEPNVVVPAYLKNTRKLPIWLYEIKGQEDLYRTLAETKSAISTPNRAPDLLNVEQSSSIINAILGLNSTAASTGGSNSGQDDSNDNEDASEIKLGRPYCRYGANCYRKNAQHKLEYSHPGDEDYVSYQNRPLCEYGANCYRKNLAHRRQFRHSSFEDPQISQGLGGPVPVASTSGGPVPVASTSGAPVPVASTSRASYDWDSAISDEDSSDSEKQKRQTDNELHLESFSFAVTPEKKRRRGSSNYSSYHSSDHSLNDRYSDSSSDQYSPPRRAPQESKANDSDCTDNRDYEDVRDYYHGYLD